MRRLIIATAGILALFIGGMIYVLWRPDSLVMFKWFKVFGLNSKLYNYRIWARSYRRFLPNFLVYSLPQALWLFSGILIFRSIWTSDENKNFLIWGATILITALGFEFGQYIHWVPGRFDLFDVLLIIVTPIVSVAVFKAIGY